MGRRATRNRFVTHFNAFTRIAIISNLVPCNAGWHVTTRVAWLASVGDRAICPRPLLRAIPSVSRAWVVGLIKLAPSPARAHTPHTSFLRQKCENMPTSTRRFNVILFAFPGHSRTEKVPDVSCLSRGLYPPPAAPLWPADSLLGFGAGGRLPIWHGLGGFMFNSSSSSVFVTGVASCACFG